MMSFSPNMAISVSCCAYLQIANTQFFEATQGLKFSWFLHGDGYLLGSGILSLPVIEPLSSHDIDLESSPLYSLWKSSSATEVFVTITAELAHSTRWAEAGHIVASTQMPLPAKSEHNSHVRGLFSPTKWPVIYWRRFLFWWIDYVLIIFAHVHDGNCLRGRHGQNCFPYI